MNDNWIKTSMVKPKEGAACLVTTQGDIALATYSEGYFNHYDNNDVCYNNVTAWQYADPHLRTKQVNIKRLLITSLILSKVVENTLTRAKSFTF